MNPKNLEKKLPNTPQGGSYLNALSLPLKLIKSIFSSESEGKTAQRVTEKQQQTEKKHEKITENTKVNLSNLKINTDESTAGVEKNRNNQEKKGSTFFVRKDIEVPVGDKVITLKKGQPLKRTKSKGPWSLVYFEDEGGNKVKFTIATEHITYENPLKKKGEENKGKGEKENKKNEKEKDVTKISSEQEKKLLERLEKLKLKYSGGINILFMTNLNSSPKMFFKFKDSMINVGEMLKKSDFGDDVALYDVYDDKLIENSFDDLKDLSAKHHANFFLNEIIEKCLSDEKIKKDSLILLTGTLRSMMPILERIKVNLEGNKKNLTFKFIVFDKGYEGSNSSAFGPDSKFVTESALRLADKIVDLGFEGKNDSVD